MLCLLTVLGCGCPLDSGMLFPRETSSREVKELNGLWKFRADMSPNRNQGFERAWYKARLEEVTEHCTAVISVLCPSLRHGGKCPSRPQCKTNAWTSVQELDTVPVVKCVSVPVLWKLLLQLLLMFEAEFRVLLSAERPCGGHARPCQLQRHHAGLQLEGLHRLGVV